MGFMKALVCALVMTFGFHSAAYVEPECEERLTRTTLKFLKKNSFLLFRTNAQNIAVSFESFENITPGSYNQLYDVEIEVNWTKSAPRQSRMKLTFYSPFICDNLRLKGAYYLSPRVN